MIKAKLIIEVGYVDGTVTAKEVKALLQAAADHLVNQGLLTGEGPAELDEWTAQVKVEGLK